MNLDYYRYCRTHRKDARIDMAKKYRDEAEGSMKRNYNSLFVAGQSAQLEKLKINEHKDDWNNMDFDSIAHLIYEEAEEVKEEIIKRYPDYKLLRLECADLKNALDFMICLCDKEIKK